jgi:hypothetical protein
VEFALCSRDMDFKYRNYSTVISFQGHEKHWAMNIYKNLLFMPYQQNKLEDPVNINIWF